MLNAITGSYDNMLAKSAIDDSLSDSNETQELDNSNLREIFTMNPLKLM